MIRGFSCMIYNHNNWHDREQLIKDIRGVFPIRIDASFENRTVFCQIYVTMH